MTKKRELLTAIANIKKYILTTPEGEPFSSSALRSFASTENIRQILNRLVKSEDMRNILDNNTIADQLMMTFLK